MDQNIESRFFRKWGEFVVENRWLVLFGLALMTAGSIYQIATKLFVDNSPDAFLDSDSESARALDTFRDTFGRDDVTLIMIGGDVFSMEYVKRLQALHKEMAAVNIDLPTLGQRNRVYKGKDAPAASTAGAGSTASTKTAATPAKDTGDGGDDEFGNDDEFGDDEFAGEDEGWGDEEGGSVFEEVTSLLNVRKTRGEDGSVIIGDFMDPMPTSEADLAALRDQVLGNPEKNIPMDATMVGQVVSKDGKWSAMILRAQFMHQIDQVKLAKHLESLLAKHQAEGFEIHASGLPMLNANFEKVILTDLQMLTGGMFLVIMVVLILMFWHPLGALVPLMVVGLSAIWALGFMATIGVPVTGITNILPAFLVCVGIADSVHLISVYRQRMVEGATSREAAIRAVADVGKPVFFTSMTTATGLISFMFATVDAIGDMGSSGAFGVMAAFFNTITLLPAMLSFNKTSKMGADRESNMTIIDKLLGAMVGLSGAGNASRNRTLAVSFGLTAVAVYGTTLLYVYHDPLVWIPEKEPVRVAFNLTDEHLGGTANVQILVEGKTERGIKDARVLQGLVDLADHIRAYEQPDTKEAIVGNARGLTDMVREIHRALNDGAQADYRIPEQQAVVDHLFVLVDNSDPLEQKRLMTLDSRITQMTVGIKWQEATAYIPLVEHIEAGIEKFIPKDLAKVSLTGAVYNVLSTVGLLVLDLIKTFGVAFLVITIFMVVLLSDLKLGLIAMGPNLLPIVFIIGLMGFADIPIDMMNLMIASIVLGIAVDDTIHLLHHFQVHYQAYGKVEAAIEHSLKHTGRALVVTSIILALGFFVYLGSAISGILRFGLLIGLSVIFALVLDITLTPALLRTFYKDRPGSAETSA